jgi:predicted DCC family thiol-disulfide oxidoreductase YuxK
VTKSADFVLFDGDCPICSRYVAPARLNEARAKLAILDARQQPKLVTELRQKGIEINDKMVVSIKGSLLVGADAIRFINARGSPSSRLCRLLFSKLPPRTIDLLYPFLVRCRRLLLTILGRKLIG